MPFPKIKRGVVIILQKSQLIKQNTRRSVTFLFFSWITYFGFIIETRCKQRYRAVFELCLNILSDCSNMWNKISFCTICTAVPEMKKPTLHTYVHTELHKCIHTYKHTYIHAYIHIYSYIHVYTYIHTLQGNALLL